MKKINEKEYSEAKMNFSVRCKDYNELEECQCDKYRAFIEEISKQVKCEGPYCIYCEVNSFKEHPPTQEAEMAIKLLKEIDNG